MFEVKTVSEAMPSLRAMFKGGGSAALIIGTEWRTLWYDPRFGCELRISGVQRFPDLPPQCGKLLRSREIANRADLESAIAEFLKDASPDESIIFNDPLP
jgi:hypothetical protein